MFSSVQFLLFCTCRLSSFVTAMYDARVYLVWTLLGIFSFFDHHYIQSSLGIVFFLRSLHSKFSSEFSRHIGMVWYGMVWCSRRIWSTHRYGMVLQAYLVYTLLGSIFFLRSLYSKFSRKPCYPSLTAKSDSAPV